ncbi:MAG: Glycosyltransferase [Puniceicoccaceae bacterium 5H]|nr:MAG: Glycosyltransferase [Puniceicoccaceae bacterium 5H]
MKILQIVKSRNLAGSEQYMLTLCRLLQRRGHTCYVAIKRGGRLEEACREQGLTVAPLSLDKPFAAFRLRKWAQQQGVEIVHCHLTGAARIGMKVAFPLEIPCVSHLHIYRDDVAYKRVAYYRKGLLIAVANHIGRYYEEKFTLQRGRVPTVLNATVAHEQPDAQRSREELRAEMLQELSLPEDSRLLLLVGRLSSGKAQDILIQALPPILARHPNTHVLLAGVAKAGTNVEQELRTLVGQLDVKDHVHFLGFRKDLARLTRAADLHLVPSRFDVLPLVVVEGMMLGAGVLASSVGGIPEIIEDGKTGFLVPPEDVGALAARINALLDEPERVRQVGEQAQAYAQSELSPDAMAAKVEKYYECLQRA